MIRFLFLGFVLRFLTAEVNRMCDRPLLGLCNILKWGPYSLFIGIIPDLSCRDGRNHELPQSVTGYYWLKPNISRVKFRSIYPGQATIVPAALRIRSWTHKFRNCVFKFWSRHGCMFAPFWAVLSCACRGFAMTDPPFRESYRISKRIHNIRKNVELEQSMTPNMLKLL